MKHMRKIIALVIAMVIMAAMVVPTMAADGKSITITGGKKGHTYTAYQILTGTVDGNELKNIQWGDGVTSGWINGRIAAAFAKTLTDEAAAKALAEGTLEYDPNARCDHRHEHHEGECGHHHEGKHQYGDEDCNRSRREGECRRDKGECEHSHCHKD